MSAIAGIFSRQGATVEQEALIRLSDSLEQLGPDGNSYVFSRTIGMVHRPFHTHRGDGSGQQPLIDADGFTLVWDGRLDNHEELRRELGGAITTETTDVALVLGAYRRWGLDALARLIGDFALAIWDPTQKRLCLACDALGLRPLYVHLTADRVAWATRARSLVEALDVPADIDDEYIADYLTNSASSHSPFRAIRPVPGGYALIVDRERAEWKRYFRFDPNREIRYRRDQDYEEHFFELFSAAVACRLRADAPVFAELSGGVDSGSIVCMADRLLERGAAEAPDLRTISYVFDQATSADERPYILAIEGQRGRSGVHMREEDYPILGKRPPASYRPDLPSNQIAYLPRYDFRAECMRDAGARVILSGIGGDQAFWSQPTAAAFELADLLVERRFVDMARAGYIWSRALRTPYPVTLWRGAVLPFLPRSWRSRSAINRPIGEWFDKDFAHRTSLHERRLGPADDLGFRLPSCAVQYSWFRQSIRHFALQTYASSGHVEVRYPYFDRRLLEFALAIPMEQKLRPRETRSVVRRSLSGVVPDAVRLRRTKAGPTEAFQRALVRERAWMTEIFAEPRLAALGIIDGRAFQTTLQRALHGVVSDSVQFSSTISLELWLQTFTPRGAPVANVTDPALAPAKYAKPAGGAEAKSERM
jgi:asparagine synthase (glutamine-hydrolysing)